MAVPKQKQSKSRTRRRRSHHALKPKQLVKCSHCGKMKLNHSVCENCGYYKDQPVLDVFKKQATKAKKKPAKDEKEAQ